MEEEIGKITHYYDKAGVVIIELSGKLSVGDTVKIKKGDHEFTQKIDSMQVEHESIETAKKGDVIGLKVKEKIKEGAVVYRVTE